MKIFYKNIIFLSLIITALFLTSCGDTSKSCCEEILNFSYTENDSLTKNNIAIAKNCAKKYHKRTEFLQKISQFYYYDAIEDYSSELTIQATKKFYNALDYINMYISKNGVVKPYDYHFRGEIYERLGDIYKDINSLKPAAALYDKALSDFESSDNNDKILNTLLKIGKLYQYNHMPDIAMIYFEMAEEKENVPNNTYRKIIDNKITTLYELNDYAKADSIFQNHFNIKIQDYDFHSAIGTKYFYERNYVKALPHLEYCFENGNQQEKLVFSEKLAESYFNTNNHEKELFYIQHQAKSNSIEIRKTPLRLDLEKLYDINGNIINAKNEIVKSNDNKHIVIILLVFAITIALSLVTLDIKQDKEKIRSAQKTIDASREIIESKDKIIDSISKKLNNLEPNSNFEESYNRFCESYIFKKIKSSLDGITILTKNVQEYSNLQLSNKDIIDLTKAFNSCFHNAIPSMRKEFEGITTSDIKFIILIFMNINTTEIAALLGLTYGATNKRYNKIKNIFNTKEDLTQFILTFVKTNF